MPLSIGSAVSKHKCSRNASKQKFECKRDQSAAEALAQIDEKKYADRISAANKRIVKIGASFSTTERNLTEWVAE
ncbi:MAG: PD-(D/E)XK nuclease domain-containing protein [Salinivirgaceae bacterium]|nr:PD-(D/E)XK nuclease domain-containing protein [Salinivirgaceae bacterium]